MAVLSPAITADLDIARGSVTAASRRRPPAWLVVAGVLVVILAAVASWIGADSDGTKDIGALSVRVAQDCWHLRWQYAAIVGLLGAVHYVASGVAARAASGLALPFGETVLVQLAASTANRLTPAGLGASAVNARYFSRRGLSAASALGAVAALGVLGAIADLVVLAVLVFAGGALGLGSGVNEIHQLASRMTRLATLVSSPWLWFGLVLIAAALAGWRWTRRRPLQAGSLRRCAAPVAELARHPRRMATLMAASGATTLVLALAFVASTYMVPGPRPHLVLGALLVAYLAGSAAGNAVPVPAGVGSTDLALVTILVAARVPAAHALEVVLIFRMVTFWFPAVAGVFAARHLRHAAAI